MAHRYKMCINEPVCNPNDNKWTGLCRKVVLPKTPTSSGMKKSSGQQTEAVSKRNVSTSCDIPSFAEVHDYRSWIPHNELSERPMLLYQDAFQGLRQREEFFRNHNAIQCGYLEDKVYRVTIWVPEEDQDTLQGLVHARSMHPETEYIETWVMEVWTTVSKHRTILKC